jgi:SAM-dependent methyltransferase
VRPVSNDLNIPPSSEPTAGEVVLRQLLQTRDAFDSVAADYDGPRGNNASIQDMRAEMWRTLDVTFAPGARLLDLGCGTGLDALRMARGGYAVTATDWSPQMVERTRERAAAAQVQERVRALACGSHELGRLEEPGQYDGAYSNLGALNCVPDLSAVAEQCARLLKPSGALVFAVIGRICPWEIGYYALRRDWQRIGVRFAAGMVPVGMNKRLVWTHYYTPREFYGAFAPLFTLQSCRSLCLLVPPPYLGWLRERHFRWYQRLRRFERRIGGWPGLRNMGDHFLMVMRKR